MTEPSVGKLDIIIATGAFESLIGFIENEEFEAKSSVPYDLSTAAGRYELAKDVSSFANVGPARILIGLHHTRAEQSTQDVVTGLDLLPEDALDIGKHLGVLRNHIHPQIAGLEILWRPSRPDSTLGLVVIKIPPQPVDSRPFLVSRVMEGTEQLKGSLVGLFTRKKDNSVPSTPDEIRRAMRSGMSTIAERLTRIETKLDAALEGATERFPEKEPGTGIDIASLTDRINRIVSDE